MEVQKHLAALERTGRLNVWHDRKILPGQKWEAEVSSALEASGIILLLVSPAFIASDYCWGVELRRAVELERERRAVVIPVIVRPCLWLETPLKELQALPTDGKPVTTWNNQDEALLDVATGIQRRLNALAPRPVVTGDETYSPSALVALRLNSIFRTKDLPPNTFFFLTPDHAFISEGFMMYFVTTDGDGRPRAAVDITLHVVEGEVSFETERGPIDRSSSYFIHPTGVGSNYSLKGRGFTSRAVLVAETPIGSVQREIIFTTRR